MKLSGGTIAGGKFFWYHKDGVESEEWRYIEIEFKVAGGRSDTSWFESG